MRISLCLSPHHFHAHSTLNGVLSQPQSPSYNNNPVLRLVMSLSKRAPPSNTSLPAKRRRLSPTADLRAFSTVSSTKSLSKPPKLIPSPFSLTTVESLPDSHNVSTVSLPSILSDPLLRQAWIFNYLHSIPFIISNLDPDTASLVNVHIVHGFWKREDPNRIALHQDASKHHNVFLHCAPMPEMFGTHHSKMFILLRNDNHAQIVIHTANMIPKDWENMTQGVWRSPLLPLLEVKKKGHKDASFEEEPLIFGSGAKFKFDLLQYLRAYDSRAGCTVTKTLRENLVKYDFSAVKGSLIASVPGRFSSLDPAPDSNQTTQWGSRGLSNALTQVRIREPEKEKDAHVVVQISSVATLGPTDTWIRENLIESLGFRKGSTMKTQLKTKVVFPTADEIRRSLYGYDSGSSIHWKLQSAQQKKQLEYMRPMLHHWANDAGTGGLLIKLLYK